MKIVGIAFVIIGLVGLLYGGITWVQRDKVFDVGPVHVMKEDHKSIPIPPIAGGLALVAGVVMLAATKKAL